MAETSQKVAKAVPISRKYPEELRTYFVESVVVQGEEDHFVLSFFELFPPPILGDTEDERRQQIDQLTSVDAKCVSRLVMTPAKTKEFIDAITSNYQSWGKNRKRHLNSAPESRKDS